MPIKISGPAGPSPPIQRKTPRSRSSATNSLTARKAAKTPAPISRLALKSRRQPVRGELGTPLSAEQSAKASSAFRRAQQFCGGARHMQFFVERNYPDFHFGVGGADAGFAPAAGAVGFAVDRDAAVVEPFANALAGKVGMLADAGAEDDRVGPAQHRQVGADVLAHPVTEQLDRQSGV